MVILKEFVSNKKRLSGLIGTNSCRVFVLELLSFNSRKPSPPTNFWLEHQLFWNGYFERSCLLQKTVVWPNRHYQLPCVALGWLLFDYPKLFLPTNFRLNVIANVLL